MSSFYNQFSIHCSICKEIFHLSLVQIICNWSLQNFAHVMTAVLSWNVHKFVVIPCLENELASHWPVWLGNIQKKTYIKVSEWVIKSNCLSGDIGQRGPYSPHKLRNHSLYIYQRQSYIDCFIEIIKWHICLIIHNQFLSKKALNRKLFFL